jgi:hypothetical protein
MHADLALGQARDRVADSLTRTGVTVTRDDV